MARPRAYREARAKLLADATRCVHCGCEISDDLPRGHPNKATADHLIPVSMGGPDTIENLVPACWSCNSARGTKDPGTWNTVDLPGTAEW